MVIVFPTCDPRQFGRAGYQLVCTLEIGNAADYPTNVILHPDHEFLEAILDPSRTPLIGHFQKIEKPGEDEWLESAYEARTDVRIER